jgi:hypothetical protein
MANARSALSAVLVAYALLAPSTSGGDPLTPAQAARDFANAVCTKIDACSSFLLELEADDVTTCRSRLSLRYSSAIEASGSGWSPSAMEACARAITASSCDEVLGHNLPNACLPPPGHLATGGACWENAQCSSGHCDLGAAGKCGTCAVRLGAVGAPCYRQDDCEFENTCVGSSERTAQPGALPAQHVRVKRAGKCTALGASGSRCDRLHPCAPTLRCKPSQPIAIGSPVNAGICGPPDTGGDSCSLNTCDALAGEQCNDVVNGTCAKIAFASGNQACGTVGGVVTYCSGGGVCRRSTGETTGTCIAPAPDFAPCDLENGPGCLWGATCVEGLCTRPSAAACQ